VDVLAEAGNGIIVRQHRLAAPLLGQNRRIVDPQSYAGVYAAVGSFTAGGFGRRASGNFSLQGGIAYGEDRDGVAQLGNALMIGGAARYVVGGGSFRPFMELGGWIVPDADFRMSRTYMNGAGTATGVGDAAGEMAHFYGRGGIAVLIGRGNELAVSGELGRTSLEIGSYVEPLSSGNPFEASVAARSEKMTIMRLRAQYTHQFGSRFEVTLWGASVWGDGEGNAVFASVPGVGPVIGIADDQPQWLEFGARAAYRIDSRFTVELFADGNDGENEVGDGLQLGLAIRSRF
jgi:hypothetical protein